MTDIIVKIEQSPKKDKRFRVFLNNGAYYDFGLKGGSTYIDHFNKTKRLNYWKRHLKNPRERVFLIDHIVCPALFSANLLLGSETK